MAQFFLSGIFYNKLYLYLQTPQYCKDSRQARGLVWVVSVAMALVTGLNAFQVAWHGVTQDRSLQSIYMVEVFDAPPPVLNGVVECLVQSYLAVRASRLFRRSPARQRTFLALVFTLIAVSFTAAVLNSVATASFTYNFQAAVEPFNYAITGALWSSTAAAVDLIISLTLYLKLRTSLRGFSQSTDSAIKRIMVVGIKTAIPTAVLQVLAAVLSIAFGNTSANFSVVWLAFAGKPLNATDPLSPPLS